MIVRRGLAAAGALLLFALAPSLGAAGDVAGTGYRRAETAGFTAVDGLALSVRLPPGPYVRNMLVRATVEVRNVRRRPVHLVRYVCPTGNLFAEVDNRSGRMVYPPAVDGPPPISCPAPIGTITLRPSALLRRRMLIILRGRYLRAVTYIQGARGAGVYPIGGPTSRLRLVSGVPPRLTIQTTPFELVTITPSDPQQTGPLWYQESTLCQHPGTPSGPTGTGTVSMRWMKAPISRDGYTFEPSCRQHVEWHLVAGFVGGPVVSVRYVRP